VAHPKIDAFAARLGLSADETAELSALVEALESGRAISAGRGDDALTTLPPQTIEPGAHPAPPPAVGSIPGDRYEPMGTIDAGGMGVITRVYDRVLNRTLAMKTLHRGLAARSDAVARFVEEAQATAQLQHPGIVPVHDFGRLDDGRVWFTMREIEGQTLEALIRSLHDASAGTGAWQRTGPWTFRRVIAAFHELCRTVAYAHDRGVVHRDLKPANIMLGAHGEVLVLDWGLAKILRSADEDGASAPPGFSEPDDDGSTWRTSRSRSVHTDRSTRSSGGDRSLETRMGTVAGTPAYMAPEQARGEVDRIDARSDVYALGAVLYHVLSGRPPYSGAQDVVACVVSGPPSRLGDSRLDDVGVFASGAEPAAARSDAGQPPIPVALVEVCEQAMAREAADRFASAGELADAIAGWLDGATRSEQALRLVERALERAPEADALTSEAEALEQAGRDALRGLPTHATADEKAEAWAQLDRAAELRVEAGLATQRVERALHAALQVDPSLEAAHAELAKRWRARHARAEAEGAVEEAATAAVQLADHANALPDGHPERARSLAWLEGSGRVVLDTEPSGATVTVEALVPENRLLVAERRPALDGTTPYDRELPMGRYRLILTQGDRQAIVSARVGRQETVALDGPDGDVRIAIPAFDAATEVYVPAGWAAIGGDPDALFALPAQRVWLDGFVIRRTPVTVGEYVAYLNALVQEGRRDEALRRAPRERGPTPDEQGALLVKKTDDGFEPPDREGTAGWASHPDNPITMVSWRDAYAYAAWLAETTGQSWRLPRELEWEKAARGTDGRFFAWGDHGDPAWCHVQGSAHANRLMPVGTYATDVSVYGMQDCGGGVRDWCAEVFGLDRPGETGPPRDLTTQRVCRGGGWDDPLRFARVCSRPRNSEGFRDRLIGFRVARDL
jgi:serine/threonine-protein kinase